MKNFWKDNWGYVIMSVLILLLIGLITWGIYDTVQYDKWYNSLTTEEKAEIDAQKAAEREKNIDRYEVLGVQKYMEEKTNRFGGVISSETAYSIQYIDGSGNLVTVDSFKHREYGLTKVLIGDKNMYVVDRNRGDIYRYLYLTKETIQNLN